MDAHHAAMRRHVMWFGSYKRAGELKKVKVWCFLNGVNIEFLTEGSSYKAERV